MEMLKPIIGGALIVFTMHAYAQTPISDFDSQAQQALNNHYQQYKNLEYFSGVALSVSIPQQKIKNYYIGNISHHDKSAKINSDTLFQIGSITKSFTAAIILQLEKEGKLKLTDTLKTWLPNYNKWSTVDIESLLNMTSGLPNYSAVPLWNAKEYQNLTHVWKNEELLSYVYPKNNFSPPLKSGYFYTNTSYILADLIIEKATQHSFSTELVERTIKLAKLNNTFYPIPKMNHEVESRMAQGYSYNQYENPELIGVNLQNNNLSWAGAAGGLVATTEDIIKWVQALFINNTILDGRQKNKLMQLVSLKTGKPVKRTTSEDPFGFGLGVAELFNKDKNLPHFWFYEGETLGFRALYMYVPCNKVIISMAFNSATNPENDHAKELIKNIYQLTLRQFPQLVCKK